jgi:hypothetical protein
MKIYTESEVRTLLNEILMLSSSVEDAMDLLTPIEIPSDEEIEDESLEENNDDLSPAEEFQRGAKYVINKIQGGNK